MQQLQTFENLTISSNAALTVEIDKAEPEKEVYEYTFLFSLPDAECLPDDARAILLWILPCVDVQYMWHPNCRTRRVLDGNWRLNLSSALTASAPVAILFNSADQNRYTFALDEVKKVTGVNLGIRDSDNTVTVEISLPLNQFAGQSSYSLRVRADFRPSPTIRRWRRPGSGGRSGCSFIRCRFPKPPAPPCTPPGTIFIRPSPTACRRRSVYWPQASA